MKLEFRFVKKNLTTKITAFYIGKVHKLKLLGIVKTIKCKHLAVAGDIRKNEQRIQKALPIWAIDLGRDVFYISTWLIVFAVLTAPYLAIKSFIR